LRELRLTALLGVLKTWTSLNVVKEGSRQEGGGGGKLDKRLLMP
jgi:hypothetical protein